eukprot:1595572-Alexandrium_andersonii.AAC.1
MPGQADGRAEPSTTWSSESLAERLAKPQEQSWSGGTASTAAATGRASAGPMTLSGRPPT